MPDTGNATGLQQVKINRSSDNVELYTATTPRNTAQYPLTDAGDAAMAAAASAGYLQLTCSNGAVIPIGTIPPLTIPAAPGGGAVAAFSQKIQAEVANGTGTYSGSIGDGTTRGPFTDSSHYLNFSVTGAPINASNYSVEIRYQTNFDTPITGETGIMKVITNGGTPQDVVTQGAAGGQRTATLTGQTLNAGANTVRIEGSSRTFFLDYIVITRAAS